MADLDAVEADAHQSFWYEPVGNSIQPCSTDPPPTVVSADKRHWIEISLVDEEGNPVSGQGYKISLPNGNVLTGKLDSRGLVRVNGIDPGTCQVTFPDLDKTAWSGPGK
jgi:hypothetical protein